MKEYVGHLYIQGVRRNSLTDNWEYYVVLDCPVSTTAKTLRKARFQVASSVMEFRTCHLTMGQIFKGLKLRLKRPEHNQSTEVRG